MIRKHEDVKKDKFGPGNFVKSYRDDTIYFVLDEYVDDNRDDMFYALSENGCVEIIKDTDVSLIKNMDGIALLSNILTTIREVERKQNYELLK